jgi:transcriptional repressor NrdR
MSPDDARWMARALEKRPVAVEDMEAAIQRIVHRLQTMGEREIPSGRLGDLVMEALRDLDEVAYVRFASVYRSFQDVTEFEDEIQRLQQLARANAARQQMSLLPDDEDSG